MPSCLITSWFRYGPTTRKSWKEQISQQYPPSNGIERSSLSHGHVFSSDSESEPDRKRKRARKQNKERPKARRTKKSEKDLELENNSKFSEAAREGIEIMHQMTQAVSVGQSMLVGLTDETESTSVPATKKRAIINGCKHTDAMFPLSDALLTNKRKKKTINQVQNITNTSSKYAHLDVFLCELRRTYENFLDNIYSQPNIAQAAMEHAEKVV